ncbi:sensor domain-containing diguanylate cyclase [Clostridium sp. MB40-C1]|uniref:sensor domain-containing diguanylate cyclase n=1 Tax=Clostridium sp. MB40-C1 TaxID=3070996 RepID=UPI0027DF043A|nr:sensor domain-containing diguanylate cyclase [Clostridium sp. MB40-C1]WMJ79828.1 sensor domain-containing diguanylate cyclase [Clostridium sp. MB40-C1]
MVRDYGLYLIIAVLIVLNLIQYYLMKKTRDRLISIDRIKDEFYSLGNQIGKVKSKDDLYNVMLSAAVSLIKAADKGSILILEEDERFYFKAIKGFGNKLKEVSLSREECYLCKYNNFKNTTIIKNPAQFDEKYLNDENKDKMNKFKALNIKYTLSAPIYIENELIGLINVDSSYEDRAFTKDDLQLMNYIKNEMQIVLKNFIIQDELRYLVNHDDLTGIYNRRIFKDIINEELVNVKYNKLNLIFVLIDIDKFKFINDTYGHIMGDKVLQEFTKTLRDNIGKNSMCARISGDEFAIFFKNCSKEKVIQLLDNINQMLFSKTINNINNLRVSFSYGICEVFSDNILSYDEVFSISDKNMYKNKREKGDIKR